MSGINLINVVTNSDLKYVHGNHQRRQVLDDLIKKGGLVYAYMGDNNKLPGGTIHQNRKVELELHKNKKAKYNTQLRRAITYKKSK